MWDQWNEVFSKHLGRADRTLISELRDVRNRWAHQEPFSTDDAYRALDSIHRLLSAVSAPEAAEVDRQKQDLLRIRFEEQARSVSKQAAVAAVQGQPTGGLKPWREVVTPQADVASGRYQQAEFAADLGQVVRGEAADEYGKPKEFFQRTFITDGLSRLMVRAVERLSGSGGDPVVELQTNFGGGKTHSMLALFHLVSGAATDELPGVESILRSAGVERPPKAARAVLVGTALSPSQSRRKADGTVVRTMWGELAYQIGGKAAYSLVAEADATGTSPGDALVELFKRYAPCLVLIDEWVRYAGQLYGVDNLPAGSFDAHFAFAQALTEAASAVSKTLLVVSVPASDIEIGGEGGRAALERLRNVVGRIESPWRPATAEESFEIVRRRLFQSIPEQTLFSERDAVVHAFSQLYRSQSQEFPPECREADYERRLTAAYPVHPELFDRLYSDWSTLDRFQRTRGVLRLMAAVIHNLWERQDGGLLIMPASVGLDESTVQQELTRYLEEPWAPIIDMDVDGPQSTPLALDRENPNLGRYSACRRVARTLFMGSAPTLNSANRGIDDRRIKLGCVQPGESVATFGDALRRLTDAATHLYVDGRRYWFSTQPSVTRLAQDRAAQQDSDAVHQEIVRRLHEDRQRGDFQGVHVVPVASGDVPDSMEARLVILGPEQWHSARSAESPGKVQAADLLERRGEGPRLNRNTLLFLAPDKARLAELEGAVRQFLAWKSIEAERERLNLDAFQSNQAQTKRQQADETVQTRIAETFQWLLIPSQSSPQAGLEWDEVRLQGVEALAVRASRRLRTDENLIVEFAPSRLRLELDRVPLWRGDQVGIKQLCTDFAQYLYLPRVQSSEVLLKSIRDGVALLTWDHDAFAYAEGFDETARRYQGLRARAHITPSIDGGSLLVKPEAAMRQLRLETETPGAVIQGPPQDIQERADVPYTTPQATAIPRRFHGSVSLDPLRVGRDAGRVAEEVIQHLTGLVGSDVKVMLDVSASIPDGVPENVVRTVTENARTLKFEQLGFEFE
jgi:predicted AAA+ superfamily ATPase